jgi:hypothetical protein
LAGWQHWALRLAAGIYFQSCAIWTGLLIYARPKTPNRLGQDNGQKI